MMDPAIQKRQLEYYAYLLWLFKCATGDQPNTPESNWYDAEYRQRTGEWPGWLRKRQHDLP